MSDDFEAHYGIISETFMKDITSRFPNVMFDYLIAHPSMVMTPVAMDEALRYFDLIELKKADNQNLHLIICLLCYYYILIQTDFYQHHIDN